MKDLSKAKTQSIYFRVTEDQKMRLKEISQQLNVGISALIRYAIDNLISKYEDVSELG